MQAGPSLVSLLSLADRPQHGNAGPDPEQQAGVDLFLLRGDRRSSASPHKGRYSKRNLQEVGHVEQRLISMPYRNLSWLSFSNCNVHVLARITSSNGIPENVRRRN